MLEKLGREGGHGVIWCPEPLTQLVGSAGQWRGGNLTSKGLLGTGDFPSTGVCVRSAPLPCSLLRSPGSGPAPLWPLQAVGQHMSALFMWVVPTPRLSFGFWFWLWGLLGGFWGHVTSTSVFVSGRRGAWKVVLTAKQPEPPHDSSEWEPLPHR